MEMIMKVNVPLIKRLREQKSWSQEHLAEASGLGVRTVQRVEREGNASSETKLALASALGVDVERLGSRGADARDEEGSEPSRPQRGMESFLHHAATYLLVCSFLAWMDWRQNGRLVWAFYPMMGWGIGLLSHGFRAWWSSRKR